MKFNNYQDFALSQLILEDPDMVYFALALCGESGEFADHVKKMKRDDNDVLTDDRVIALAKELGDLLWYIAVCADRLGFKLEEIAEMNIEKLTKRKKKGTIKGSGDNR